jgi:acetyl esterase/lipase
MDESAMKMLSEWNMKMADEDRIPLWEAGKVPDYHEEYGQREPSIVVFLPKGNPDETALRGAVLVCAGGGFYLKAPHEGWPICEWLNRHGIAAFLLDYRLTPYRLPTIIGDAKRAMRVIRHRSEEWHVNPRKVGILGFSAGGQITVSVSTLFDEGDPNASDPIERVSCRPDAQVPCYPAISMVIRNGEDEGWRSWVNSLLGPDAPDDLIRMYSAECSVRDTTPPAFLWGTCDDFLYEFWPPYLAALKKKDISFECHIFSNGPHGMGLAQEHPTAGAWPDRAAAWLILQGF